METKEIEKIKNKHYCANNKTVGEQFNDAISEAYSLGLKERSVYELYGYLFEGKFYGDLEMLRNKTMSESNKPLPLFVKTDSEERDKDIKEWISVKETPPKEKVQLYVCDVNGRMATESVHKGSDLQYYGNFFGIKITHWMPEIKAPNL